MSSNLYEIARRYRDIAWQQQNELPEDAIDHAAADDPRSDSEHWWYQQGRAEAFALVMSELER